MIHDYIPWTKFFYEYLLEDETMDVEPAPSEVNWRDKYIA
jgi:hypothetical protein